jgi:hypothetical protein
LRGVERPLGGWFLTRCMVARTRTFMSALGETTTETELAQVKGGARVHTFIRDRERQLLARSRHNLRGGHHLDDDSIGSVPMTPVMVVPIPPIGPVVIPIRIGMVVPVTIPRSPYAERDARAVEVESLRRRRAGGGQSHRADTAERKRCCYRQIEK